MIFKLVSKLIIKISTISILNFKIIFEKLIQTNLEYKIVSN